MSSPAPSLRPLILTSAITFLLIGAEQSLYGPAFGSFQARFDLDSTQVSLTVSLHFLGAFVTILSSGLLIRVIGYRPLLSGSALALSLGTLLVGVGGTWPTVLVGSSIAGLGFGALNVATNLLVVRSWVTKVAPVLIVLNTLFGLGAILGPVLVASAAPRYETAFLATAALGAIVFLLMLRQESPAPLRPQPVAVGTALRLAGAFIAIYFLYVSAEIGTASWQATHLTPYLGPVRAAALTSLFWGAMTVGRLLAVPISAVVRPGTLVVGASLLAFVAALLTMFVPLAPYAYVLIGLAFAPIFPGVLAWLHSAHPNRAEQLTPLAFAGANLGPVATAPLIGAAVGSAGPGAVPFALAGLTALLLVVSGSLLFSDRRSADHTGE